MPPSIASTRDPPQPLVEDYGAGPTTTTTTTSKHNNKTTSLMSDFQARKKMLEGESRASGSCSKTSKKKSTKKAASKNNAPSSKSQPATESGTAMINQPASSTTDPLLSTAAGVGGLGMGVYGGMGYGMYGGMMGSPYGMGMGYGTGPLSSLNQFLFGVQTAIYSLSSAVQVIGMNTQALHQLLDAASSMLDHALATWHEMRALEANEKATETEEQKMRRRRLKALRWALVVAATFTAFRLLRSLFAARKKGRRRPPLTADPYHNSSLVQAGGYSPYSSGGYGMSPYGSGMGGMYGAGGVHGGGGSGYY
jgi:hypothetical protein